MNLKEEFKPGGVYSLELMCLNLLRKRADLEYIGWVPYHMLKPILVQLVPRKLYRLEKNNKRLLPFTDELWERHLKQYFPDEYDNAIKNYKTFRHAYLTLKIQERKKEEELINQLRIKREKLISKPTKILPGCPKLPNSRGYISKPKSLFGKAMNSYKRDQSIFSNKRR